MVFLLKTFTLVGWLLATPPTANAQLRWQNMDSLFSPLPVGFHVFKTVDSLGGKPNVAWYAEIDVAQKQMECNAMVSPTGKRHTPQTYYDSILAKPLLVVNGTFFSFADNRNLNVVITDGKLKAFNLATIPAGSDSCFYISRGAIGITKRRKPDVAWVYTDTSSKYAYALSQPSAVKGNLPDPNLADLLTANRGLRAKKWKVQTAIGGGPVLVQKGAITITNREERMFVSGLNDRHPRTLMGYTSTQKLIVMVIEGRHPSLAEGATLAQEAQLLIDLGCVEGLNLDGGGSSCMLINGKPTIVVSDKEGQRPVPAVFTIALKKP